MIRNWRVNKLQPILASGQTGATNDENLRKLEHLGFCAFSW